MQSTNHALVGINIEMSLEPEVIRSIVVDDEPQNLLMLQHVINEYFGSEITVVETFENALDALKFINGNKIDVVFLDVEMPEMNGFELITAISENSDARIVIVSSHEKYAVKAFRHDVFDYLQKPVAPNDIRDFLSKMKKSNSYVNEEFNETGMLDNILVVNRQDKTIFMEISQITRMEASGSYTDIYLEDGSKVNSTKKMNHYESLLAKYPFYKLHRSHLINLNKIREIVKTEGEGMVVMHDGSQIEISRAKKDEFLRMMLKFRKS